MNKSNSNAANNLDTKGLAEFYALKQAEKNDLLNLMRVASSGNSRVLTVFIQNFTLSGHHINDG